VRATIGFLGVMDKYSNFKIVNFPDKLKSLRERVTTPPVYVRLKPVNYCNHDCFFCVYAQSARKKNTRDDVIDHVASDMHKDINLNDAIPNMKLIEISNDLVDIGVKAVTYSGGGEPFLHPKVEESADILLAGGVRISAITNGQLLGSPKARPFWEASWIRVSIDYSTSEEMARSRNVPETYFSEVLKNIEIFASNKSEGTDLFVNYIVHKENISDLFGIAEKLKMRGVQNVRFSPMWTPDYVEYHKPISSFVEQQISRIEDVLSSPTFSVTSTYNLDMIEHSSVRSYKRCFVMETIPVIGADCNVYACHNKAFDKTGLIGEIKSQSFREMWFSDETRSYFDTFDANKTCQHQCSNDSKNLILHQIMNASNDPFI